MADLPTAPLRSSDKPSFQMIRVLNKNEFPIGDMYDGVPMVFKPNEPLNIPVDAAAHMFGWPADPPVSHGLIARRHGWNTQADIARVDKDGKPLDPTGANRMRWELWAEKIEVSPVHYDLVQRDPDAPIPAISDDEAADDLMTESERPPDRPRAETDKPGDTKVGTRNRNAPKRAPRRVDV